MPGESGRNSARNAGRRAEPARRCVRLTRCGRVPDRPDRMLSRRPTTNFPPIGGRFGPSASRKAPGARRSISAAAYRLDPASARSPRQGPRRRDRRRDRPVGRHGPEETHAARPAPAADPAVDGGGRSCPGTAARQRRARSPARPHAAGRSKASLTARPAAAANNEVDTGSSRPARPGSGP